MVQPAARVHITRRFWNTDSESLERFLSSSSCMLSGAGRNGRFYLKKVDRGRINGLGCDFYNSIWEPILDIEVKSCTSLWEGKGHTTGSVYEGLIGTQTHVHASYKQTTHSTWYTNFVYLSPITMHQSITLKSGTTKCL